MTNPNNLYFQQLLLSEKTQEEISFLELHLSDLLENIRTREINRHQKSLSQKEYQVLQDCSSEFTEKLLQIVLQEVIFDQTPQVKMNQVKAIFKIP